MVKFKGCIWFITMQVSFLYVFSVALALYKKQNLMMETGENGAHRLLNSKLLDDQMIKQAQGVSSSNRFEEGTKGKLKDYLSTYRSTLGRTQF